MINLKELSIEKLKEYYQDKRYTSMMDVGMFVLLIFSFHFLYLIWVAVDYSPFTQSVYRLFDWASTLLFDQSCWVLEHVFHVDLKASYLVEVYMYYIQSARILFISLNIQPRKAALAISVPSHILISWKK